MGLTAIRGWRGWLLYLYILEGYAITLTWSKPINLQVGMAHVLLAMGAGNYVACSNCLR